MEKRWVYGTRSGCWVQVGPEDRDYDGAITPEEMRVLGPAAAKERYLSATIVGSGLPAGMVGESIVQLMAAVVGSD